MGYNGSKRGLPFATGLMDHRNFIGQEYQDEFAEDILSVAAAKEKRDQLKEIEETIKSELSQALGVGCLGLQHWQGMTRNRRSP